MTPVLPQIMLSMALFILSLLSRYRQKYFWLCVLGGLNVGFFGVYIVTGGHHNRQNGGDKVYAMGLLVAACLCTIFNLLVLASHHYTRHVASHKVRGHEKNFIDRWEKIKKR